MAILNYMVTSNHVHLLVFDTGSETIIEIVKARSGFRAKGRDVIESGEGFQLLENPTTYKALFKGEKEDIDLKNTYSWLV